MKTILKKKKEELNKLGYCKVRIGSVKLLKKITKRKSIVFNCNLLIYHLLLLYFCFSALL